MWEGTIVCLALYRNLTGPFHRCFNDAGPRQTNCDQYTGVDATQSCQTPIKCRTQDERETTLSHWSQAASQHGGVIRRSEHVYTNWEGNIVSWANQSGWAIRIRQKRRDLNRVKCIEQLDQSKCDPDNLWNNDSGTDAIMQAKQPINMWWFHLKTKKFCVPADFGFFCRWGRTTGIQRWDRLIERKGVTTQNVNHGSHKILLTVVCLLQFFSQTSYRCAPFWLLG